MSKPIRKAAGFVIYRRINGVNQYLLIKASSLNHHWTPPKGHLEKFETPLDAAIRETEEETGIKVSDLHIQYDFQKVLKYEPKGKNFIKQVTYWLARILKPDLPIVLSEEHLQYEWLKLDEAKEHAAYPELQELFDETEKFIIEFEKNEHILR